jgi:hypothetical protein
MAWANIVGCDLCDAIGMHDDPNFHQIRCDVENKNGEPVVFSTRPGHRDAILCSQCAAPIVAVAQRLRDRRAQELLDARIDNALKEGKI